MDSLDGGGWRLPVLDRGVSWSCCISDFSCLPHTVDVTLAEHALRMTAASSRDISLQESDGQRHSWTPAQSAPRFVVIESLWWSDVAA